MINDLVLKGQKALEDYHKLDQSTVDYIVKKCKVEKLLLISISFCSILK